jgi:hypothetical protein
LTGRTGRHRYSFSFDGTNGGRGELTKRVRTDEDGITCVNDARLDNSRDDGPDEGNREGVVDAEFKWCIDVVFAMMREDVQELPDEIKRFASNIGDLEDGADALTDKLSGRVDALLARLDKDRYFAGSRGFEDLG